MKQDEQKQQNEIDYPEYCYVDTALGDVSYRNNVKKIEDVVLPDPPVECYMSMFRFKIEFKEHCDKTGSVKDTSDISCYCDFLWFDIDDEGNPEQARVNAIELVARIAAFAPNIIDSVALYFSGCKGYHVGIPSACFGAEPRPDLPQIFRESAKTIAGDIPIDTSIYEKNRLWRIPITINKKSGLYKIPLTYEELAQKDAEAIKKLAGSRRAPTLTASLTSKHIDVLHQLYNNAISEINQAKSDSATQELSGINNPNWIAGAIGNLTEGNRNTTFTSIAGRLHREGWEPNEIIALLTPHAANRYFPLNELERLICGICARYPVDVSVSDFPLYIEGKRETETFSQNILTFAEFMAMEDTEIEWRVDRIFPSEGVGIIGSPAGYGKSWMLIDLAVEIARGGQWLGHFDTTRGTVLYFDEESSLSLLKHRFKRVLGAKELIDSQLDIHLAVGTGVCFNDPKYIEYVRALIKTIKPAVVIIDSLIRVHRAEENSAKEMSRIFATIKDLVREGHCLFIFADHQRKLGNFRSSGDQQLRGSTEKVAFIDTLLSLQRLSGRLIVEHAKSRFAEPISDFVISIEDLLPGTTTIAYQGDAEQTKKEDRLKKAFEFLDKVLPDDDWISRKELVDKAEEMSVGRKLLAEALKELESEDHIERQDIKTDRGRGGKSAHFRRKSPVRSEALIG